MDISPKFLSVNRLKKSFPDGAKQKTILEDVSFELSPRESIAVMGPSGCGKTTLLLVIAGLIPATEGSVWLDGDQVIKPTRKMALVLQEYGLFPWKTVAANIMLGARLQRIQISSERLMAVKKELGIEGFDHLYPMQLSGGQRQRVALARAILLQPCLLLLDEPFAAIDTITRERLQNGLLAIFKRGGFSFIIVTHNIEEAVFLGRKIVVIDNHTKSIKTILDNPEMGNHDYRNRPEFFARSLELRNVLEGLE